MPIMAWLHYADHALDPIRRSSSGSYVAVADTHYESNSRYGDPAYQIDLYQRNAMITGFALEHVC